MLCQEDDIRNLVSQWDLVVASVDGVVQPLKKRKSKANPKPKPASKPKAKGKAAK